VLLAYATIRYYADPSSMHPLATIVIVTRYANLCISIGASPFLMLSSRRSDVRDPGQPGGVSHLRHVGAGRCICADVRQNRDRALATVV